ncbi:MAG: SRPBCC domain-containing protein [Aeromicrobium erythreum]
MDLTIDKDLENATLTVTATFAHPVEKVWDLYADPRKLERWWGPPSHPATVVEHDLRPGGVVRYFMTSPEGEQYHGRWDVDAVDEGKHFEARDGFADADGNLVDGMPVTTMVYTFESTDSGARMTSVARYASTEDLAKVLEMGMEEGMTLAMGQMEDVLADA